MEQQTSIPHSLPGLWRKRGGLDGLVRLDTPAVTAAMVIVAKEGEPWRDRPELHWQVLPDELGAVSRS